MTEKTHVQYKSHLCTGEKPPVELPSIFMFLIVEKALLAQ